MTLRSPWHADIRRVWVRRLREMDIGQTLSFPHDITVKRGQWTYAVTDEFGRSVNLTRDIGIAKNSSYMQRIERIVDWIIERSKTLTNTVDGLSSTQLMILHELNRYDEMRRSDFTSSDLEPLYQRHFIRDVMTKPGKIALTKAGLDALLPPAPGSQWDDKTPGEPEAARQAPPTPTPQSAASLPVGGATTSSTEKGASLRTPVANGILSAPALTCLRQIAAKGGETSESTAGHALIIKKLIAEELIERTGEGKVAITSKGIQRLEAEAKADLPKTKSNHRRNTIRPSTPTAMQATPHPDSDDAQRSLAVASASEDARPAAAPSSPQPVDIQMFESSPLDDDIRAKAAVFDLLAPHSPALQAAYEGYKALGKAVERVKGI